MLRWSILHPTKKKGLGRRISKAKLGPESLDAPKQNSTQVCVRRGALPDEKWKPQPRAKPDGRGEGNEAQAAHQEDMPLDNRQPVVLSYCPSNWQSR